MKLRRAFVAIVLCLAGMAFPAAVAAQPAEWQNTFVLYGWGTGIDGDMTIGPVESSTAVDFNQILGSLELAAMARYRGHNEHWAFVADAIFAGLGGTHEGTFVEEDLDFDEIIFQADAAYRMNQNVEFLLGARYVRLQTTLKITTILDGAARLENDATFIDPVVGVRFFGAPGEKLRLQAQADIGGGAAMDLTWQAMFDVGYQATDRVSLWLGYRALSMDFDDSGARNRFSADLLSHGPVVGAALHF
jgi:opacity protein-like surface antigen